MHFKLLWKCKDLFVSPGKNSSFRSITHVSELKRLSARQLLISALCENDKNTPYRHFESAKFCLQDARSVSLYPHDLSLIWLGIRNKLILQKEV